MAETGYSSVSALGSFEIPEVDTESRGTDAAVTDGIELLTTAISEFTSIHQTIGSVGTKMLDGWYGDTAEKFETEFPKLITEIEEIVEVIKGYKTKAEIADADYKNCDKTV